MWYGCGNTSLPNPSTIRIGLQRNGRIAIHMGAVDIGQGSFTVVTQICAEAVGVPVDRFDLLSADTDVSPDCGKTSASRQTFVSGNAGMLAGRMLRQEILKVAGGWPEGTRVELSDSCLHLCDESTSKWVGLAELPLDARGYVFSAEATYDPPTQPLDADGQGIPYAVYGFGAHLAEVEVDPETGVVRLLAYTAVDDCGRVLDHVMTEGQVHGAVAQGVGQALMEDGVYERASGQLLAGTFMDYAMPRADDLPNFTVAAHPVRCTTNPLGVKGVGEAGTTGALAAVMNAIADAIPTEAGRRLDMPATPQKVWQACRTLT
jgi:CO/xanthine dehydrogenase Mo-binding subunit